MTKHMRLIVSVLFIVIIILAIAITRFNSSNDKSSANGNTQPAVSKKLSSDRSGNRIFQDNQGLYGILDNNDRLIVSPEWHEINFTDSDLCIASKRIKGKNLYGCIDYEGNIRVPFIYSGINSVKMNGHTMYIAKISDAKKCVVYDSNFNPCFSRSWDDCTISNNNELVLTNGNDTYKYTITSSGLVFTDALLKGAVSNCNYQFEVTSRVLLSKLTVSALERMEYAVGRYMEYAFTGNSTVLADVDATPSAMFLTLFPEEHSITSKNLAKITDVFVYSKRSEDGLLHYAVSVTADVSITYKNSDDKVKRLRGNHKAVIDFEGISANDLKVVSAKFVDDKPVYPPNDSQSTSEPASAVQVNTAANQLINNVVGIYN